MTVETVRGDERIVVVTSQGRLNATQRRIMESCGVDPCDVKHIQNPESLDSLLSSSFFALFVFLALVYLGSVRLSIYHSVSDLPGALNYW